MADELNAPKPGDTSNKLLQKICNRLGSFLTGLGSNVTATLTVSDIEIGAVELKDASSDTRAKIVGAAPGAGDDGIVVRNIPSGTQDVSIVSSDLATEATLGAGLGVIDSDLDAILAALGNPLSVTGPLTDAQLRAAAVPVSGPLTDTQLRAAAVPISVASLPLPAGAATEATFSHADATLGATADPEYAGFLQSGGVASMNSILKGIFSQLSGSSSSSVDIEGWFGSQSPTLGQKPMALSIPVVLASDQSNLIVQALDDRTDNAPFTDGVSTISAAGFIFDESAGTALTENDCAAARIDSKRAQVFVFEDATTRGRRAVVSAAGAISVAGPITDTELRASAVPVSGPLTDTQLRASSVPVSGPLTDTQLRASAVPISAATLPLPTNAATDRSLANAPFSVRASDGTNFYDIVKTGQLPSALVGGRLDVNIGAWLGSTAPSVGQKTMASSVPVVIASDQTVIPASQSGTWTVQPGNTQNTTPWLTQRLRRATYETMTAELTLGTATGKNRIISFFHPSAVSALDYEIAKIILYFKATHTAGVGQYKISFSSAESATGNVLNTQPYRRADAPSGVSARSATTADGTLAGNAFGGYTKALTAITGEDAGSAVVLYEHFEDSGISPITLRANTAEGILVYQDVTSTLTTAPIVAARIIWIEK